MFQRLNELQNEKGKMNIFEEMKGVEEKYGSAQRRSLELKI